MDEIIDLNTLFGPLPIASTDLSVDALVTLMQRHRVEAACTLSTLGVLLDPTIGNSATRAACAEHAELIPVATFNPTNFFGYPQPIQSLYDDGFRLVRFFPAAQQWPIDFAPFAQLGEMLAPMRMPLMVHVEEPGDVTALMRVLGGYPGPVILSNVDAPLLAEAVAAMRTYPNWHAETSRLLAPGNIKLIADTVGAERLLFGTGAPSRPMASALNTLRFSGLNEPAHRQILFENARRVLGA